MNFIEEMKDRNLVAQITHEDELSSHVTQPRSAYCGFDPTAASLHVGHLLPVMTLARWQRAGHRVIALMGGGTALIGDPTGKTEMRKMLNDETIASNIDGFKRQVSGLLDFSRRELGIICNNADWLKPLNYLKFLREIGSQFSVNRMLTAECFKSRLETSGLSFLEFNYMLLQSYDFLHLAKHEDCTVQLGGDDQWSNMLSGVDLVRRMLSKKAFCMTTPLLTTSDGRKMGKTEKGAVWLDPNLTTPYEYFQFWRNIPDDRVGVCLRYFTFLRMNEIRSLEKLRDKEINYAKEVLAFETTRLIHGDDEALKARIGAQSLFTGGGSLEGNEPLVELSRIELTAGVPILDLLVKVGAAPTKAEAKRLVKQGGISCGEQKITDFDQKIDLSYFDAQQGCLLKKGKKYYYRLRISD